MSTPSGAAEGSHACRGSAGPFPSPSLLLADSGRVRAFRIGTLPAASVPGGGALGGGMFGECAAGAAARSVCAPVCCWCWTWSPTFGEVESDLRGSMWGRCSLKSSVDCETALSALPARVPHLDPPPPSAPQSSLLPTSKGNDILTSCFPPPPRPPAPAFLPVPQAPSRSFG